MSFNEPNAHTETLVAQLQFPKTGDIHEFQLLSFSFIFYTKSEVHGYNIRQASRGDLFLKRKTTFGVKLGEFSIQVQGFEAPYLF